jgi:lia operon protein LiaF
MNSDFFQKFTWGLVIIMAGVFFLLNQLGLISFDIGYIFSTYWPVILIYSGLMGFIWKLRVHGGGAVWSLMLCAVGVIFLLRNLELTTLSVGQMFQFLGPAALILFGLSIIFKPSRSSRRGGQSWEWDSSSSTSKKQSREAYREQRYQYREARHRYKHERSHSRKEGKPGQSEQPERAEELRRNLSAEEKEVLKDIHGEFDPDKHNESWDLPDPPHAPEAAELPRRPRPPFENKSKYYDDFVNNYNVQGAQYKSSFIGDVHLGNEPWELQPMVISHFIGDTVIDLTRASIPLGETPITVSSFIGDVKIFVPGDMDIAVKVSSSSFIGDMRVLDHHESGMFRHLKTQTMHYEEAQHKLVLTTSMFIGDVIVKKIG